MEQLISINEQIDIDLQGYQAGDGEPDCSTQVYDLSGRRIDDGSNQ